MENTEEMTTLEIVAWMRAIRLREEAAGRDPMQNEEYLLARALSADAAGRDIDRWKERHLGPRRDERAGYEIAEADEGRQ